ncbi:Chordin-like protein 2 [Channa argus]|uniref:Chordin-like protein 2 n=1 Tax=Channa argus TaxID=215402 RepID=A0A6G1QUJ5_CHAAH|nr:Chordin-like protein 2 [Channa argus]
MYKTYNPGDNWHPYLEPFGLMFCMRSICTETGHVKCNTIKCPALTCENPVSDPQQCCPRCTESKAESNQTQCFFGYKNNLLVYKVDSSFKVDPPHAVRIIAVERQSTAEVEVQVWKTVEGVLQLMEIGDVQRKDIVDHPENYTLLTILDEASSSLQMRSEIVRN